VIGLPKTIDNDIAWTSQSFGFHTAVEEARRVILAAHAEARGAENGIGLVKLMGRHSGFIAAHAARASGVSNFCLIPEMEVKLDDLLQRLEHRLSRRGSAVIVVAEGAGQDLLDHSGATDASGNARLGDIGLFLKERITRHLADRGLEAIDDGSGATWWDRTGVDIRRSNG
jgi:6-phosphofructokinase 1